MRYADLRESCRFSPVFHLLPSKNVVCLCLGVMAGGCSVLETQKPVADAHPATLTADAPPPVTEAPPPEAPADVATPTPRPKKSGHRATAKSRAPATQTASIDPNRLIGLDMDGVRRILGEPASVREGDVSREWRYAMQGCSFRIFFYPNLKGATFLALKYSFDDEDGDVGDPSDVCARRVLTARGNGTG